MKAIYLLISFISVAFLATSGIFVRSSQVPPITTGFYCVLFSIPVLLIIKLLWDKKQISLQNNTSNYVLKSNKIWLFFAGLFLGADLVLWNLAFTHTSIANAHLLGNLVPFVMVPASYFLYKERISLTYFIGLILALVGTYVLISAKAKFGHGELGGDLMAIGASILYASFLLVVHKVRHTVNTINVMYWTSWGALFIQLIAAIVIEGVHIPTTWASLWPILGLTLFAQLLGQGGFSYIMGKISALMTSIIVLLPPVISAFYAYIIFDEALSTQKVLGICIVICGLFIANMKKFKLIKN